MSDSTPVSPRPVSCVTIVVILAFFGLFIFLADMAYVHHRSAAPQNETPENLAKDQAWRATDYARRQYLIEIREKQTQQLGAYGWVDQKTGVVQLPIDRAVELVAAQYGASK